MNILIVYIEEYQRCHGKGKKIKIGSGYLCESVG